MAVGWLSSVRTLTGGASESALRRLPVTLEFAARWARGLPGSASSFTFPDLVQDYREWATPSADCLNACVPWICAPARRLIERHLPQDGLAFEFGSGGSTLFLSALAKSVVSVEHDFAWHARVASALQLRRVMNVDLRLVPPNQVDSPLDLADPTSPFSPTSSQPRWASHSFRDYVSQLENSELEGRVDVVLVDGRARPACLLAALSSLRIGGLALLDNSRRPSYQRAIALARQFCETEELCGPTPGTRRFTFAQAFLLRKPLAQVVGR